MAATTKDRSTPALGQPGLLSRLALLAGTVIPNGVMVGATATGATNAADTAGMRIVGRSTHRADQTAGDAVIIAQTGVYAFGASVALAAAAAGRLWREVYVVDNQTVGLASDTVNRVVAGVLIQVSDGKYYVALGLGATASLPSGALTGAGVAPIANAAVSPAEITLGVDGLIPIAIPDAADTTYVYKSAEDIEIIDAWLIKDGAGAANTIQITDAADAAITNAMVAAVDKTVTRAGTIDPAKVLVAAGATFKVVAHRAAGVMTAKLFIRARKV